MNKKYGIPMEEPHALLDASVVAGAATGAVAGMVGGPPGVVLGGVIGAAVGIVSGDALERAARGEQRHDRELDDAIGVTAGDLGARDVIRSETSVDSSGHTAAAAAFLRADHGRLEVIYERLLEAYRLGDWNDVRAEWEIFEPALRAHMELEETQVFPSFREVDPDEAEHLQWEHELLRSRLDVLGVNVELHAVTKLDAEELIERLRMHRVREERLLYPWVDAKFDEPIWFAPKAPR